MRQCEKQYKRDRRNPKIPETFWKVVDRHLANTYGKNNSTSRSMTTKPISLAFAISLTREEEAMGQQDLSRSLSGISSPSRLGVPQRILEGAESCLRSNSYLALKNVSCEYHEGVLTLRGCLPSYYLKQIAQTAVATVDGVSRINNEIEVIASSRR
jgi:osmotically-inducible protein OsmY